MSDTPLRLVLFDFDGTLCDSAATIIRLMKQACACCDLPVPEDSLSAAILVMVSSHAALAYAMATLKRPASWQKPIVILRAMNIWWSAAA